MRRGVAFVRELVPLPAIALVAHLVYNEPYRALPMRSVAPAQATNAPGRIVYQWRTSAGWQQVGATAWGDPAIPDAASEAAFITEHYWGYTRQRDGGTVEYRVAHPAWRLWPARDATLEVDAPGVYGQPFARTLALPPVSSFVAEGSPVAVFRPQRIPNIR